jgi:hypothetical protein
MPHVHRLILSRASSTGNPVSRAFTLEAADTVLAVLLKINGATNRAGGAPSVGGVAFTQANAVQKAAASPEASCELWYLLNPRERGLAAGAQTLTVPNTGGLTVFSTLVGAQAAAGGRSTFIGANGSNGTSANPSAGAVSVGETGAIGYAVCCSGLTDFDPATPSHTGFEAGSGTPLGTFDDGAHGGGQQLVNDPTPGSITMGWTVGSDDWGAVAAFFGEVRPHDVNNLKSVDGGEGIGVTEKAGFR